MAARRLTDRITEAARDELAAAGFKKRGGAIFTVDLGGEVLGWLGLNSAQEHQAAGSVEVNPVVGLRHQGLERMVAELQETPFHAYQPPTVSRPLGYLMPDSRYLAWTVNTTEAEMGDQVRAMVGAIRHHGLMFMRANCQLDALCRLLDEKLGFEHQTIYRRPVAWLLAERRDRAREALRDAVNGVGDRHDAGAEQLRRFAGRLERLLAA